MHQELVGAAGDQQAAADAIRSAGNQQAAARQGKYAGGRARKLKAAADEAQRVDRLRSGHGAGGDESDADLKRIGRRGGVEVRVGSRVIVRGVCDDAVCAVGGEIGAGHRVARQDTGRDRGQRRGSGEDDLIIGGAEGAREISGATGGALRETGESNRRRLAGRVGHREGRSSGRQGKRAGGFGRSRRAVDGVTEAGAGQREASAAESVGQGRSGVAHRQGGPR